MKIEPLAGQRKKGETWRAVQACNDWLRLGPGRTIAGLHRCYQKTPEKATSRSIYTLQHWSQIHGWTDRAELYDVAMEEAKNTRIKQIMNEGLALVHERVLKLKDLADFLEQQLYEQDEEGHYHSVWVPDVKQIGSGEDAERVNIERFNQAIISEFRATLDDLAKELGARRANVDLTTGGQAIIFSVQGIDLKNDV